MENEVNEFVNPGGEPIGSKIPNIDPKTSAKTTTDKSVRMRAQPFMYTVYRRFFSESELLLLLRFCKTGGFAVGISGDITCLITSFITSFLITTGLTFTIVFCFFIGDNEVKKVAGIM